MVVYCALCLLALGMLVITAANDLRVSRAEEVMPPTLRRSRQRVYLGGLLVGLAAGMLLVGLVATLVRAWTG
jgi:hypothetical protein